MTTFARGYKTTATQLGLAEALEGGSAARLLPVAYSPATIIHPPGV